MVSSVTLTPSLYTDHVRGRLAQTVEVEEEKLLVYVTVVWTDRLKEGRMCPFSMRIVWSSRH